MSVNLEKYRSADGPIVTHVAVTMSKRQSDRYKSLKKKLARGGINLNEIARDRLEKLMTDIEAEL